MYKFAMVGGKQEFTVIGDYKGGVHRSRRYKESTVVGVEEKERIRRGRR